MSTPLLELEQLAVGFGGRPVVEGLSLVLAPGEAVALAGANGSGKSTVLRTLIGLLPAQAGVIRLDGREITRWPPERRARAGLGYVPEGRRVFPGLTVRETLEAACWDGAAGRRALLEQVFALFPPLALKADERAWRLSGGQQQMLAIGRALAGRPRLLLLDEPLLGLSPDLARRVSGAIAVIAGRGTAVLVAEESGTLPRVAVGRALRLG